MNNVRNKELLEKLGNHVRMARLKKGMTMEELAYASDVELSQIYRIETAKINVTISSLYAISKGLEITLQTLLEDLDLSSIVTDNK